MENENETKNNNFHLLRFIAASFVIVSHSFSLLKNEQVNFLGVLGVTIFFIISGYLITKSWMLNPNFTKFIIKRLVRILPALCFCTIVTIVIIGPLVTSIPFVKYFSNGHTWLYFKNILLFPLQFTLPGVFENNSSPYIVNHSLWTLPIEFIAYLLVVFLGLCTLLNKKIIIAGVIVLIITDVYLRRFSFYGTIAFYNIGINGIVPYFIYFFIGSAVYLSKIRIRFNIFLCFFSVMIVACSFFLPIFLYGYYFAIPYLVFATAFLNKKLSFRKTDLSYGMYLFSMPIQQTFIHFFPRINSPILLVVSFAVTLTLAFISWHGIESKFLFLRKKL